MEGSDCNTDRKSCIKNDAALFDKLCCGHCGQLVFYDNKKIMLKNFDGCCKTEGCNGQILPLVLLVVAF